MQIIVPKSESTTLNNDGPVPSNASTPTHPLSHEYAESSLRQSTDGYLTSRRKGRTTYLSAKMQGTNRRRLIQNEVRSLIEEEARQKNVFGCNSRRLGYDENKRWPSKYHILSLKKQRPPDKMSCPRHSSPFIVLPSKDGVNSFGSMQERGTGTHPQKMLESF